MLPNIYITIFPILFSFCFKSLSRDRVSKQNYLTGLEMPADFMGLQPLKPFFFGESYRKNRNFSRAKNTSNLV